MWKQRKPALTPANSLNLVYSLEDTTTLAYVTLCTMIDFLKMSRSHTTFTSMASSYNTFWCHTHTYTHSHPHNAKENLIHSTRPVFLITLWSSYDAHMPSVEALGGVEESAWASLCSYAASNSVCSEIFVS